MQVSTKSEVENATMKENSNRFCLACSSPLLENKLCRELGSSKEGNLSKDLLESQAMLQNLPEVQEVFEMFCNSHHEKIHAEIACEQ